MMSNNALFLSLRLVAAVNGWRRAEEIHLGENWRLGDCTQANFSVSRITENFTQPATEQNGMCAFDILKMLQYCPSVSEPNLIKDVHVILFGAGGKLTDDEISSDLFLLLETTQGNQTVAICYQIDDHLFLILIRFF